MPDKDTATKKTKEETQEEEPKSKISSFSLLDTPKLEVEELTSEEESEQTASVNEAEPEEEATPEVSEVKEEPEATTERQVEKPEEKTEKIKTPLSSEEVKKWLTDVRPDTTKEVEKGGGPNFKLILFILAALLLIGAVVGGIIYFKSNVSKPGVEKETGQAGVSLTPTPSVTPTPEAKIDFSKYSVNVLNGSGVVGEAGRVAESLKDLKFKEIKTGNAESYDFTTTSVRLKAEVPDKVYEKISEVLSASYNVEKAKDALDKDSTYDIVITVGTKK